MDAASFASSSKKRKYVKEEDVGLGKDFISKLPDDILHHVLSFLLAKDLVRASVLSKRWRCVCTFFPVIDIDLDSVNEMHELRTGFLDLVEREMLIPSRARIRKFRLNLSNPIVDASDVMLWVDKVMQHKVEELDLSLPGQTFCKLPDRLFSSSLLVTLKLVMDGELMVPNSVCFPSLKILHLSLLEFSSVQSTLKLFGSCPVLKELVLDNCFWGRINNIVISFPSLQTLSIDHDPFSPDDILDSMIKIVAPNLLSFKCTSYLTVDLVLCDLFSLEDAYISVMIMRSEDEELGRRRALKLLHGIQGVESLTLSNDTLETLEFGFGLLAELPTFHNLKHLEVDCACPEYTPRSLIEVLQKLPNLHSLSMGEGLHPDALSEGVGILKIVPQCFKTSLKRFELARFDGTIADIRLLKYVLENAALLENISIIRSDDLSTSMEKQLEILNELETCRGATNCEIEFLD